MIKKMKKGSSASYKGYLLGIKEYEEYMELKEMIPKLIKTVEELK